MSTKRVFKKYQSLINHYHQKDIRWWLDHHPELRDCDYLVAEKLDGANFGVHLFSDGEIRCSKRSGFIGENDSFFGYRDAYLDEHLQALVSALSARAQHQGVEITLHGELFGPGIQKRVDYGAKRSILFYGIDINGIPQPAQEFLDSVPEHMRVPVLGITKGFEAALAHQNEFPSRLNPVEGNTCEGIVISPLDVCPVNANGEALVVKSKNERFSETKQQAPRARDSLEGPADELSRIAASHVTGARLASVISKMGEPSNASQFGDIMRALITDINEEMLHEHREQLQGLSSGDRKRCMSAANKEASELIRALFRDAGLM